MNQPHRADPPTPPASASLPGNPKVAPKVSIERLRLHRFRNYEALSLDCDSRHVVLSGENGSGKTNLLEAISFLSPGRGLRRAAYEQVARVAPGHHDADLQADAEAGTWAVNARLDGGNGPVTIGTGLQRGPTGVDGQRRISIDGAGRRTADDLLERVRVVWLTPAMDGLFTGAASDRRRFLDRMVLAIDPGHGRRVNDYDRAMRARNRLLDGSARGHGDAAFLDGVEAQMAEQGTAIAFARAELVGLLSAQSLPGGSAFPTARLLMEGTLEAALAGDDTPPAADVEDAFRARLARNRPRDAAAGRTLEGPHRANLAVVHADKGMAAALCSTGEQKALLTGMVLAHAALVAHLAAMTPVLLLDECAAHLDHHRRAALFDLIDTIGCQAWMTGTDAPLFEALGDRAQHFTVHDGSVEAAL